MISDSIMKIGMFNVFEMGSEDAVNICRFKGIYAKTTIKVPKSTLIYWYLYFCINLLKNT